MLTDKDLQALYDKILIIVELSITDMYSQPISILQKRKPSMDDILRLCRLFLDLAKGTEIHGEFQEAVAVVGEAAQAVQDDDEQRLTDCAYHLEDFLGRMRA